MFYIIFLVLIYFITETLYLLTAFNQFLFPYSSHLVTTNLISFSMNLFLCWNIIDLQHYVSSWYIRVILYFCPFQNDHHDNSSYHLSPYKDMHNHWLYSPYRTVHPMTYLFCNWDFVSLNFPHLFHSSPLPLPPATTCLFSKSMTLFLFCYVCSIVLYFRFHVQMKSYSICFSLSDFFYLA